MSAKKDEIATRKDDSLASSDLRVSASPVQSAVWFVLVVVHWEQISTTNDEEPRFFALVACINRLRTAFTCLR